jgi:transposase
VEAQDLAVAQEKCAAERRLIVFIDESGLSERPTRVRTWALKVCTLLVLFHFNWKHVSAVAGLTRSSFLFRLYDGAVKSAQIVEFLKALRAHLKRKLLNAWDGAAQHKSRIVREYLDGTKGSAQMALLPAYSPDLNPVEYLWARLKRHALANFCPKSLAELKTPRATSCAAVNTASRSSLRAGSRTSCGDVLAYVKFNNEDQYSQRWAPQSTPMVACLRGRLVCVR